MVPTDLRLLDTATGEARPLALRTDGEVSIYCCGPTVYDVPHLGHGRAVLVYDILRRYLAYSGLSVTFVANITDVDDKIIDRASQEGRSPASVATEYEAAWYAALDALGVARPDADPHATAWIEEMIVLVDALMQRGSAYATSRGVFFDTSSVPDYGLLAHQTLESLRAGARVGEDSEKRSPADFALWKLAPAGELAWDSPWGRGRPGWHTECVAMSLGLLGEAFDLHTGGLDLRFPHHENERAQAVALDRPFARHWMHHAFVEVNGTKMSKSLGNFTSLIDLLERTDPRAYRLLVLQSHYRTPLEVSAVAIEESAAAVARLDNLMRRVAQAGFDLSRSEPDPHVLARFKRAMDDDLDTPAAIGLVFDLARAANGAMDRDENPAPMVLAVGEITQVMGLMLKVDADLVDPEAQALVDQREAARSSRDWAAADQLRARLEAAGWVVEDTPAGTRLHRTS